MFIFKCFFIVFKSWKRCADLLEWRTSTKQLVDLRDKALCSLFDSLIAIDPPSKILCYSAVRAYRELVFAEQKFPKKSKSDGNDLFDQLARCHEIVDRLRIGALELRCGVEGNAFDVVLASELSVLLNVALTKCRNVLDQVCFVGFLCVFFVCANINELISFI